MSPPPWRRPREIISQRQAPAAHAAIILSLEAVFAALGGWLFLGELLDMRGVFGCGLMLSGMLLSQMPAILRLARKNTGQP